MDQPYILLLGQGFIPVWEFHRTVIQGFDPNRGYSQLNTSLSFERHLQVIIFSLKTICVGFVNQ